MLPFMPKFAKISIESQMEWFVLVRFHRKYSGSPLEVVVFELVDRWDRSFCDFFYDWASELVYSS